MTKEISKEYVIDKGVRDKAYHNLRRYLFFIVKKQEFTLKNSKYKRWSRIESTAL